MIDKRVIKKGRNCQKTDTLERWDHYDPIILKGEICIAIKEDGSLGIKIADKDQLWSQTPWWPAEPTPGGEPMWGRAGDYTAYLIDNDGSNTIEEGVVNTSILSGSGLTATESNTAYAQNMVVTNNLVLPEWTDPVSGTTYPAIDIRNLDLDQEQADWNTTESTEKSFIKNKPFETVDGTTIIVENGQLKATCEAQKQANYAQNTSTEIDYIKSRPTIEAAFAVRQLKTYPLLVTDNNIFSSSTTSTTFFKAMTPYNYNNGDNYYASLSPVFGAGDSSIALNLGSSTNNVSGVIKFLNLHGSTVLRQHKYADDGNYTILLPGKNGIVALTDDIPEKKLPYVKSITPHELTVIAGDTNDSDQIALLRKFSGEDYSKDEVYYVIIVPQSEHERTTVGGLLLLDEDDNYVLADMNINQPDQTVTVLVQNSFTGTLIIS